MVRVERRRLLTHAATLMSICKRQTAQVFGLHTFWKRMFIMTTSLVDENWQHTRERLSLPVPSIRCTMPISPSTREIASRSDTFLFRHSQHRAIHLVIPAIFSVRRGERFPRHSSVGAVCLQPMQAELICWVKG